VADESKRKPDARQDDETRKRLATIAEHYENFSARVSHLLWLMVALIVGGAIVFTILLNKTSDLATKAHTLAQQNATLAQKASAQAQEIQANRVAQCNQANTRHFNTVAALRRLYKQSPAKGVFTARIVTGPNTGVTLVLQYDTSAQRKQSEQSTLGLINALAPYRDCGALTGGGKRRQAKKGH
jgi:outer membrane murein-binding lipoprotein Lpp